MDHDNELSERRGPLPQVLVEPRERAIPRKRRGVAVIRWKCLLYRRKICPRMHSTVRSNRSLIRVESARAIYCHLAADAVFRSVSLSCSARLRSAAGALACPSDGSIRWIAGRFGTKVSLNPARNPSAIRAHMGFSRTRAPKNRSACAPMKTKQAPRTATTARLTPSATLNNHPSQDFRRLRKKRQEQLLAAG
jgi:hypothetical protein